MFSGTHREAAIDHRVSKLTRINNVQCVGIFVNETRRNIEGNDSYFTEPP
jgi:hypothetical protein